MGLKIRANLKAKGAAIAIRYKCIRWSEVCSDIYLVKDIVNKKVNTVIFGFVANAGIHQHQGILIAVIYR